jgi:hypothetical protein
VEYILFREQNAQAIVFSLAFYKAR